ncbi:MAG: hypothetical protein O3A46_12215 [Candidatus Poribacteria bacterium]|nr:hypothetical protein [Candidatus Poribacteria bacterium]
MKSQLTGILIATFTLGVSVGAFSQTGGTGGESDVAQSVSFGVHVSEMIYWLTPQQDATAAGTLAHWDHTVVEDGSTESVAILRLVLNRDVRLIGTATPLTNPNNPNATLATFVSVETDGDGTLDSLLDGTGDPATGFGVDELGAERGVGVGNYVYIGGGTATAGTGDANVWATPERMSELSSVSTSAQYSLGSLLANGAVIRHVPTDGAVMITVRLRARNGEDFGADSDDTEAPELAVETPYVATVQLTALP